MLGIDSRVWRRQEPPLRTGTRSPGRSLWGSRQRGRAVEEAVRGCGWLVVPGLAQGMRGENTKVRKADIAAHVPDKTSVSKADAEAAVTAVLGAITDALARSESVSRTMPVVESVTTAAQRSEP